MWVLIIMMVGLGPGATGTSSVQTEFANEQLRETAREKVKSNSLIRTISFCAQVK